MLCISKLCLRRLNRLTVDLVGPTGIVLEDGNGLTKIFVKCLLIRLAVVPRINSSKYVRILFAKVAQLPEQLSPLGS